MVVKLLPLTVKQEENIMVVEHINTLIWIFCTLAVFDPEPGVIIMIIVLGLYKFLVLY